MSRASSRRSRPGRFICSAIRAAGISPSASRRIFLDLVRTLILVEPGGALAADLEAGLPPGEPLIAIGPLYAEAAERIRRGEIDEGLKMAIDVTAAPEAGTGRPERLKQMFRDNARTLLGQIKGQRAPFALADAEAISAPTLLMAGERSPASFHRILDGWRRRSGT